MHVAEALLGAGEVVVGLDILTGDSLNLKRDRISRLTHYKNFNFCNQNLSSFHKLKQIFEKHKPSKVIHLAAKASVTNSAEGIEAYIEANLVSFVNIIELCSVHKVAHFMYASSSNVYGVNSNSFFHESDNTDRPLSLYAATKKSNEVIAHSYSNTHRLPTTGLRLFSVFGPWSSNNTVVFNFAKRILDGERLRLADDGQVARDFTFIDDAVVAITRILEKIPGTVESNDSNLLNGTSVNIPYKILNIGSSRPVKIIDLIQRLEIILGAKAKLEGIPLQSIELRTTAADNNEVGKTIGFEPITSLDLGLRASIEWFTEYYNYELGG
jgi:UDP-glucuronate 4-epimerase